MLEAYIHGGTMTIVHSSYKHSIHYSYIFVISSNNEDIHIRCFYDDFDYTQKVFSLIIMPKKNFILF